MSSVCRFFQAVAGFAVLAVLTPAGADAAGWVTGAPLSAPREAAVTPMAAVSPSGERIVAWERQTPGLSSNTPLGLAVRVAPPGGDFGQVQLFADPQAGDASLTIGADGTAALVWMSDDNLHVATRPPGRGSFSDAAPLALGARALDPPKVVVADGAVYVALSTRALDNNENFTSTIRAFRLAGGAASIDSLPGTGPDGVLDRDSYNINTQLERQVISPTIALDGDTIHVAWQELLYAAPSGTSFTLVKRVSGSTAAGTLGAPVGVAEVRQPNEERADDVFPTIAAGGGHVDVAWAPPAGGQIAYQDLTGAAGVQTLTAPGGAFNLRAGVDAAGALVLAWEASSVADGVVHIDSAIVAPDGVAGPVTRLTPPNAERRLDDFVLGADGSTLAVPDRRFSSSSGNAAVQVQAAFRPAGGAFGAIEEVSGPHDQTGNSANDSAAGAVGRDGDALIAWTADDRSGVLASRLFVSERDATPPAIAGVSVPMAAVAGAGVAMSAAATDALSATTVTWDFGDGSQATGPSVSHVYGTPGSYAVTVVATDTSGNSTTQSRTIAVTGGASVGGDGGTGTSGPDRRPPVLSALRTSNSRFRVASSVTAQLAARSGRAPTGTVFSLRLDERATLIFAITGKAVGRRAGTKCVPGRTGRPRCRVAVTASPFVRAARGPGAVSVPFTGRLPSGALSPGSYTASVTAIDASGNRSRPVTVAFTVVLR